MIEYIHNVEEKTFDKMPDSIKEYVEDRRIVRCKDCKHWINGDGENGICSSRPNVWQMKTDDFCSYGERREP